MKLYCRLLSCFILLAPFWAMAQVTPAADSSGRPDSANLVKKDSVNITDTAKTVKVNCYTEWLDAFRTRGAKPVTDGKQEVVIALKDNETCHCFMGQVEVVGGKIKPPLLVQQENGEFRPISVVGKKLEPAFTGTLTADELYAIKDGMSIVFRTTDQEYGRLFFYKFANKSTQKNKEAMSPSALITD